MFPNVPACSGFYRRPRILGYSDTDQVLRKHVDENDRKSYPVKTTGQVGHPTSFPGFSPTRPMERERERDPGKRWSRGSGTKLFLREESFVSHFCVWFIRDVHTVIATAR